VRMAALGALDERRDPAAIAPLEALIQRGEFNGDLQHYAQRVLVRLKKGQEQTNLPSPGAEN